MDDSIFGTLVKSVNLISHFQEFSEDFLTISARRTILLRLRIASSTRSMTSRCGSFPNDSSVSLVGSV